MAQLKAAAPAALNPNVGVASFVSPVGPAEIVGTGGAVVSTFHVNEAELVSAVALVA
jgi:hypothetical protein